MLISFKWKKNSFQSTYNDKKILEATGTISPISLIFECNTM